jgi:2,3-diketo-5-methylthio-1-phosphopentane phosphatase
MPKELLNRSSLQVYCDFDGTITDRDSFDYLLEKLAPPVYLEIEAKWQKDDITARECMRLQTALIPGSWSRVAEVLQDVSVEATFAPFARWCKNSGIALYVVSDGVDRVIKHILQREGIQVDFVWSNQLVVDVDGKFSLAFPNAIGDCPLGICKCALLDRAGPAFTRVVIGDGKSDFCWAKGADLLFAKAKLLDFCRQEGLAHIEFENFATVQKTLADSFMSTQTEAEQIASAIKCQ